MFAPCLLGARARAGFTELNRTECSGWEDPGIHSQGCVCALQGTVPPLTMARGTADGLGAEACPSGPLQRPCRIIVSKEEVKSLLPQGRRLLMASDIPAWFSRVNWKPGVKFSCMGDSSPISENWRKKGPVHPPQGTNHPRKLQKQLGKQEDKTKKECGLGTQELKGTRV